MNCAILVSRVIDYHSVADFVFCVTTYHPNYHVNLIAVFFFVVIHRAWGAL